MTRALAGDNFPTFHGDPNIDLLLEDFLADYDIACEAYGIDTNAKKGKFLSSRLKGYALEVYKSELQDHDGIKDDYAAITDLLAQRFSRLFANRRTGTTNFYSRNQQEGESIVSYFHELTKLAKHAYPGERMPDSQFLERLLRGMLPWSKHKVVAQEVRTSQEALEAAVTVEANKAYLDEEKRIAVASVRPVPNENKELEKKVDKLSSAINQISSRLGENLYSRQQRMAPPNPFWQRRRWPNPQHHFPGDTQQPRFTPRRFNNSKRGNYNSRGQQKCWSCGQHGHWMSICPQGNQRRDHRDREHRPPHRTGVGAVAATSQPAPDDISPQLTRNATSSGGGGRVSSALYLYTVAIICLCLTPLSSAQRPTICDTISPGQLLALPSVGKCSQPNASLTDHPVDVTYDIYKYNHIKYDVAGWICRAVQSKARLLTYFFGDEHLQQFTSQELTVSTKECKAMLDTKSSAFGPLHLLETGVWATSNKLNWRQPNWGLPECCKWVEYTAQNAFIIPVRVYKSHDEQHFSCSGADVTKCSSYFNNQCQLNRQALLWEANERAQCQYVFYKTFHGRQLQGSWLADSGQIALTSSKGKVKEDCGQTLHISDQGLAYVPHTSNNRSRRETEDGPVSSSQLAASEQALYVRLRTELTYAFQHTWKQRCEATRSNTLMWRIAAKNDPTAVVRTLLKDASLYARAGTNFLEVWKCMPLARGEWELLPQTDKCTEEIPLKFEMHNTTNHGFLDPVTLLVSHTGKPTDCALADNLPLTIYGKTYYYDRNSGDLIQTLPLTKMPVLPISTAPHHFELMSPFIFRPVNMYTWEELQPSDHLNAILHAAAAQTEILTLLGVQFQSNGQKSLADMSEDFATSVVGKGLKSMLVLLSNPFHVWVFITLIVLHIFAIYSLMQKMKGKIPLWLRRRATADLEAPPQSEAELEPLTQVLRRNLPEDLADSLSINCMTNGEHAMIVLGSVNSNPARFLFDSGSAISLISRRIIDKLGLQFKPVTCPPAVSVTGEAIPLYGELTLKLKLGELQVTQLFRVFDAEDQDGIIGYDCMRKWEDISVTQR